VRGFDLHETERNLLAGLEGISVDANFGDATWRAARVGAYGRGGENIPRGLKPLDIEDGSCGTAKAVPFQSWLSLKLAVLSKLAVVRRGGSDRGSRGVRRRDLGKIRRAGILLR
jgi:hypothetical protein